MSPHFASPDERVLSAGEYLAGALALAVPLAALGFAAARLRRALAPDWSGPPALVADLVLGLALAAWLGELLGLLGLFTLWAYIAGALALAALAPLAARALGRRVAAGNVPPAPPGPR